MERCEVTGNECGTDTRPAFDGKVQPCSCAPCQRYHQQCETQRSEREQPMRGIIVTADVSVEQRRRFMESVRTMGRGPVILLPLQEVVIGPASEVTIPATADDFIAEYKKP